MSSLRRLAGISTGYWAALMVFFPPWYLVGGPSSEFTGVTHWEGKMNRLQGLPACFWGRLKIFSIGPGKEGEYGPPLVRLMTMYMTFLDEIANSSDLLSFSHLWLP